MLQRELPKPPANLSDVIMIDREAREAASRMLENA
jgi:hypothetical protein